MPTDAFLVKSWVSDHRGHRFCPDFPIFSNQNGAGKLVSTVFLFLKEFIAPKPWTRRSREHSDWKKIAKSDKIGVHGWLVKTSWTPARRGHRFVWCSLHVCGPCFFVKMLTSMSFLHVIRLGLFARLVCIAMFLLLQLLRAVVMF